MIIDDKLTAYLVIYSDHMIFGLDKRHANIRLTLAKPHDVHSLGHKVKLVPPQQEVLGGDALEHICAQSLRGLHQLALDCTLCDDHGRGLVSCDGLIIPYRVSPGIDRVYPRSRDLPWFARDWLIPQR